MDRDHIWTMLHIILCTPPHLTTTLTPARLTPGRVELADCMGQINRLIFIHQPRASQCIIIQHSSRGISKVRPLPHLGWRLDQPPLPFSQAPCWFRPLGAMVHVSQGQDPSSCGSSCWSCSRTRRARASLPGRAMAGSSR